MKTVLLAAAASALVTGVACAEDGGAGNPSRIRTPAAALSRSFSFADTGSEAYPDFVSRPGQCLALGGAVLLSAGSEGAVQTAASLPTGFSDGTTATMQAQAVARYFAGLQLHRDPARLQMQLATAAPDRPRRN